MVLHDSTPTIRILPGSAVIARIRRVLVLALIAAFAYSVLSTGGKAYCPGGFDGEGGFIDAAGNPTSQAPMCISLNLQPSPLVFLGIVLIVLLAIGRVLKTADETTAIRTLDRAAAWVAVLAVCALAISRVWFGLIPITDLDLSSFHVFGPFPFGFIDVEISPLRTS